MRALTSRLTTALVAFVVGAAVAAGVAYATIPDSGAGTITGCYPTSGKAAGALRVVDAQKGVHCKTGEATITWPGRGFRFLGQWSAASAYGKNDVVRYLGSAYIAVKANQNVAPTDATNWALMISGGAKGDPGAMQSCIEYPHPDVDWSGCDLDGANLTGANLAGANLANASFGGSNLTSVNLTDADTSSAGFIGATITGIVWSHTICPDQSLSDSNGTSPQSCVGHGTGL